MRWVFRLTGGLVGLIIVVFFSVPFIPAQSIADLAAREISARFGRDVTIGGKVSAVVYPMIGVKTGELTIQNAPWAEAQNMISAKGLVIGIAFWPLLAGDVQINELILRAPDIRLERARDGRVNWVLGGGAMPDARGSTTGAQGGTTAVSLALAGITSGRLSFVDHGTGTAFAFEDVDLTLSAPDLKKRTKIRGSFVYRGNRTSFSGGINETAGFIGGGVSDLDLSAKGPLGLVSITGRAGLDPRIAELDIDTNILDVPALLKLAGQSGDIVKGYGNRATFKGRLTVPGDGAAYVRNMTASLGANEFSGEMDIDFNGVRPRVTARLSAGDLDFSPLLGTSKQGGAGKKDRGAAPGWSQDRLNVEALGLIDGEVALDAPSVDLGLIKLGATKLRARLDTSRLVLTLGDMEAYGGKIGGEYIVNGRGGLSMHADLSLEGVDMKRLLVDLADYDRLSTHADLTLKFLGRGDSVDDLLNSLSGSGRFIAGQGELAGLDIVGMLRNLDASYRGRGSKTIFSTLTGGFTIKGGILENNDLSFRSSLVTARGDGQVDIGKQQVTYRLTPVSFSDIDPLGQRGIAVPVLITGPWSGLHYKADLKGVFDARLKQERKKAKKRLQGDADKARAKAQKKLRKQLDKAIKNGVGKLLKDAPKQ